MADSDRPEKRGVFTTLHNLFLPFNKTVKRLVSRCHGHEDGKWASQAVESLAKRLRKKRGALEELERAVSNPHTPSNCVTIPRSQDGRIQVSNRKGHPHVIYCKLWRWPDLTSHHELRAIEACEFPFSTRLTEVCINPYHYNRVGNPKLPSVVVTKAAGSTSESNATLALPMANNNAFSVSQNVMLCDPTDAYDNPAFSKDTAESRKAAKNEKLAAFAMQKLNESLAKLEMYKAANNRAKSNQAKSNQAKSNQATSNQARYDLAANNQPSTSTAVINPVVHNPNTYGSNAYSANASSSNASSSNASSSNATYSTGMYSAGTSSSQSYSQDAHSSAMANPVSHNPNAYSAATNSMAINNPTAYNNNMAPNNPVAYNADNQVAYNAANPGVCNVENPVACNNTQTISYEEPTYWSKVAYYELNSRVGEIFNCKHHVITVDGYTDPTFENGRLCIGALSNVHRNSVVENTRRHIGQGIQLHYVAGQVWVECLSPQSIFVQSVTCNLEFGLDPTTVIKVPSGSALKIFDNLFFANLLCKKVQESFEAVHELNKNCSIRMSFVKGWGKEYHRKDVTETPCWIEIHLNGAFRWLDNVISCAGGPANGTVSQ